MAKQKGLAARMDVVLRVCVIGRVRESKARKYLCIIHRILLNLVVLLHRDSLLSTDNLGRE